MKTLAFFSALLLLLTACERLAPQPVDQLPPATQEGANTFGCLVDGEVFLPKSESILHLPYSASYGYGSRSGSAQIRVINTDIGMTLGFYFEKILFEPTYFVLPSHDTLPNTTIILNPEIFLQKGNSHPLDYRLANGFIDITALDTLDVRFVSGTFAFDFVNETDDSDTVSVTDGRFDLKF
jgi:hypothetical protein